MLEKWGGALQKLKNMTVSLNSPKGVMKVAFHLSSSWRQILLYPQCMSNLVKIVESFMLSMSSGINGNG